MNEEKQAEEREKFQLECVNLSKQHKHLLIQAATGVGKGLAVARCIAASVSPKKWLIVVPEIIQIENYKKDLIKHGYEWLIKHKIEAIICYTSLHKYENQGLNLHMNECHRITEARGDILRNIEFDQIISDSATVTKDALLELENICPFHIYDLSMDEAIKRGILPSPSIHLIGIELDGKIRRNSVKFGKKVTRQLTDVGMSKHYDENIEYWNKKVRELSEEGKPYKWAETRMIKTGLARKKFLAECKTIHARGIIGKLMMKKKRFVCFCGSVDQAEDLGGNHSISSSRGKKHNSVTIEKFNTGEIDSIFFNKMGKEGMNFADIEALIIVQLDSGNDGGLSIIQKVGRGMRSKEPEIYILYCEGTQDEFYLKRALKQFDKQYIIKEN